MMTRANATIVGVGVRPNIHAVLLHNPATVTDDEDEDEDEDEEDEDEDEDDEDDEEDEEDDEEEDEELIE